jgi:hypothetical protein
MHEVIEEKKEALEAESSAKKRLPPGEAHKRLGLGMATAAPAPPPPASLHSVLDMKDGILGEMTSKQKLTTQGWKCYVDSSMGALPLLSNHAPTLIILT